MSYEGGRGVGVRRARGQRGSALLIVFVFAAIIAIALYAEMPIAVFEAKREKEQLLIDRGNEYAHAVKLFVRKFGMYPATVDQLENTNRMRFLRHRFKDPFTGKDDWRMLHAGPGGQLVDSKVKPAGLGNLPGSGPGSNSSSSFGSTNTGSAFGATNTGSAFGSGNAGTGTTASSGFGQSGFGSSSSGNSGDTVVVPDLPQRPPAISANGAAPGGSSEAGASTEGGQNPSSAPSDDLREQMAAVEQAQPALPTENAGQTAGGETAGAGSGQNGVGQAGTGGSQVGPNQAGQNQSGQNSASGQAGANGAPDGQNAMDTVRKMLNNPAIGAPLAGSNAGNGQGQPGLGQISGGGIAGVASKAHGHSIKTVNDQTDYSLWEFYYDPTKDLTRNTPGLPGAQGNEQVGAGTNGINTGASPNANGQSAFGQSSFGQNSSGQNSFGQNSGNSNSPGPTAPPANPPQ